MSIDTRFDGIKSFLRNPLKAFTPFTVLHNSLLCSPVAKEKSSLRKPTLQGRVMRIVQC